MAAIFGISEQAFDKGQRNLLPESGQHVQKIEGRPWFKASAYVRAFADKQSSKVEAANGDPLLGFDGFDSPQLERYRAARAGLAEMELEKARGTHASLAELKTALSVIFAGVRSALEQSRNQPAADVAELIAEATEEAEKECARLFESSGNGACPAGAGEPAHSETADNAAVCGGGNQDTDRAISGPAVQCDAAAVHPVVAG